MNGMENGTVSWYNEDKGFGFIKSDSSGEDVFAHFSAISVDIGGKRTLEEGQRVTFIAEQTSKGLVATKITALQP